MALIKARLIYFASCVDRVCTINIINLLVCIEQNDVGRSRKNNRTGKKPNTNCRFHCIIHTVLSDLLHIIYLTWHFKTRATFFTFLNFNCFFNSPKKQQHNTLFQINESIENS